MQQYLYILCIFFAFVSGCTTVGPVPAEQKEQGTHIIRNVPFYPQEDFQCGPASLAAVLNFWGISVTPEQVAKDIYSNSAQGTLNIDMLLYAQSRGLAAFQYRGRMEDLREKVDGGRPLIVLVDYGFSILQANHFMVIVGYNEHGVIANSGKEEMKVIPVEDFLASWEKTKFWTLFITRK
jgi:ABC-type bacteriocin/lantibiotic exporter with double-glycine peptidase domain